MLTLFTIKPKQINMLNTTLLHATFSDSNLRGHEESMRSYLATKSDYNAISS